MKSKWLRILLSVGCMTAMYFVPDSSLQSVKRALEVMVIGHLGLEVLRKMQQG
jgi:hypothetical protein